jgi:hypothetical protein
MKRRSEERRSAPPAREPKVRSHTAPIRPRTLAAILCSFVIAAFVPRAWLPIKTAGKPPIPGFDAANAERILLTLCAMGPRTVGSPVTERDATALLHKELLAVQQTAARSSHGAVLELETVSFSGAFYTDFTNGFTNVYQNASSVVAKLTWPGSASDAVLVSAHFDSWPTSPGAADNGVNVATIIEAARTLAAGPPQPQPFIFLLNGAEEVNWVGVHGFATQHRCVQREPSSHSLLLPRLAACWAGD